MGLPPSPTSPWKFLESEPGIGSPQGGRKHSWGSDRPCSVDGTGGLNPGAKSQAPLGPPGALSALQVWTAPGPQVGADLGVGWEEVGGGRRRDEH